MGYIGAKSLAKEAMSLEARLTTARADLRKAEDVRRALDSAREQDEVRRLALILRVLWLYYLFEAYSFVRSQVSSRLSSTAHVLHSSPSELARCIFLVTMHSFPCCRLFSLQQIAIATSHVSVRVFLTR